VGRQPAARSRPGHAPSLTALSARETAVPPEVTMAGETHRAKARAVTEMPRWKNGRCAKCAMEEGPVHEVRAAEEERPIHEHPAAHDKSWLLDHDGALMSRASRSCTLGFKATEAVKRLASVK
jgi:hypothetical protein